MCLAIAMYILTATFGILVKIILVMSIFFLNVLGNTIYLVYALFQILVRTQTETE